MLTVTGSDKADVIQINDNGSSVRVFDGITLKGTFAGVNSINVNTKAGNDSVRYEVQGDIPFIFGNRSFAVRRTIKKMDGVKSIERGPHEDEALITYDAAKVKPEQFVEAINGLGFKAGTPVKG